MKTSLGNHLVALAGALALVMNANADFTITQTVSVGLPVADNDASGLASWTTVPAPTPPSTILSLTVRLNLTGTGFGGWTGDLYAWLQHNGDIAVLLNRPGKSSVNPFGYSDDSLDVLFDDAATGDIHTYQETLGFAPGTLSGPWQPDGRATDPDLVLPEDARSVLLGRFVGEDPAGDWTLFVADMSGGGEFKLESWELSILARPIPEPETTGVLFGALGLGRLFWCRRRRHA